MKLWLFFLKGISWALGRLPMAWQMALGDILGWIWFDVLRFRRGVIHANLDIAFPELSKAEKNQIARRSCLNLGRTLIEFLLLPALRAQDFKEYFVIEGSEYFWRAHRQGKGVLLLSMHLGSADFALNALAASGFPIQLITKTFSNRWLNDLWFAIRGKFGVRFIDDRNSTFDILRGLHSGDGVIFVLDQFTGPPIGIEVQFFGKRAGTAQGLAVFALKTKAPVLPVYSFRRADNKLVIEFGEEIPLRIGDSKRESICFNTQVYNDKIEQIVRRYPEFWMWIHRRWKENWYKNDDHQ